MELCRGGDLQQFRMRNGGKVSEDEAKKVFEDLVRGLFVLK